MSARNSSSKPSSPTSDTPAKGSADGSRDVAGVTTPPTAQQSPGKGRPTRSRREAEAANRRPLVVTDRKEAKRRDRAARNQERDRSQQALMTGDEANMPAQHRGPQRRLVRDVVDTRRNIAEYFFPVALGLMVVALVAPFFLPQLYNVMSLVMLVVLWGGIIACILDSLRLRKRLRTTLTEEFGDVQRGLVGYGVMRSLQIRRWRLPRAQVAHGEAPRQ